MSLFVDLRQINDSVSNLSAMVDKISSATFKNKPNMERKKSIDSSLYGSSIFKPTTLGFGVRFSQSQEDIYQSMPSARLRSHMSLPNLGKVEQKTSHNTNTRPKIEEIDDDDDEKDDDKNTQTSESINNHWILAYLNKRPYFDDSGNIHPIDFLDSIKYYISELNISNEKQLPFIISCLDGLPLMWARCFKKEFTDVNSFYEAFEEEFWGPERQKSILYDLKLGKYEENKTKMNMSEYFLYKVSNYRHLTPPPSDLEIVYSLAAHFPPAVELELRLTPKPTLREAYSLLRRKEGEANDFLPNYLYEMCEAFQKGLRPESARRPCDSQNKCKKDPNGTSSK